MFTHPLHIFHTLFEAINQPASCSLKPTLFILLRTPYILPDQMYLPIGLPTTHRNSLWIISNLSCDRCNLVSCYKINYLSSKRPITHEHSLLVLISISKFHTKILKTKVKSRTSLYTNNRARSIIR